jgi:hypothetical protein
MKNLMRFDIDKWDDELLRLWTSYTTFTELMTNRSLLLSHQVNYNPFVMGYKLIYDKFKQGDKLEEHEINLLDRLLEPFDQTHYTFARLMIVGFASAMEFMINDFFLVLFNNQPYKIIEYNKLLGNTRKDVPISTINELLNHESINEFIIAIAMDNANNASSGSKKQVFKRLKRLS